MGREVRRVPPAWGRWLVFAGVFVGEETRDVLAWRRECREVET